MYFVPEIKMLVNKVLYRIRTLLRIYLHIFSNDIIIVDRKELLTTKYGQKNIS